MNETHLLKVSNIEILKFFSDRKSKHKEDSEFGYWYSSYNNTFYFKGIRMEDSFNSIGNNIVGNIYIENSILNQILFIRINLNGKVPRYSISVKNSKILSIDIKESKFESIGFTGIEVEQINLRNNLDANHINIQNLKKGKILAYDFEVKSFELDKVDCLEVIFDKVKVRNLNLIENKIIQLKITNSIIRDFSLNRSIIGNFRFLRNTIEEIAEIINETRILEIEINQKEIKRLSLRGSYIQNFSWKHDKLCIVTISYCTIEYLNFERTILFKDSVFQISDSSIKLISIILFTNSALLYFNGIRPLRYYSKFLTEEDSQPKPITKVIEALSLVSGNKIETLDFEFEDISESKATVKLINSDLGKTSFIDCKFDSFKNFYFYNTKMLEVFVADTKFTSEIIIPEILQGQNKENEQHRLAYGQFKKIYENRGDNVTATEYLSREMQTYRKELKIKMNSIINSQREHQLFLENKKESNFLLKWFQNRINDFRLLGRKEWWNIFGEKINLWLNYFSSYHGTNWIRGVIVTFGITLLFYSIYCWFLGYRCKILDLLSYSPEFLNPLRKADFLKNSHGDYIIQPECKSYEGFARFWDYFSRIVIAYFAYQTIQAFRRFGKTK